MLYALEISRELYRWIQEKERSGKIHSIFKNTINIISEDGRFIPIYTNDKAMSPNSIKLKEKIDFENLHIKIDQSCIFKRESFKTMGIEVNYKNSLIWDNRLKLDFQTDSVESLVEKMKLVKSFILEKGNKNGIFPLMEFLPENLFDLEEKKTEDKAHLFIKDRFITFLKYFKDREKAEINNFSKKIIGFGPGLTPSMDDFLSGMMTSNLYISYLLGLDREDAYKLNEEIVDDIDGMTTLVSEEMLKLSSIGEVNEDIRGFMVSLTGKANKGKIEELMAKVIEFGNSSGTDILCGIYVGSYILLNENSIKKL